MTAPVLIRGGTAFDGTGAPGVPADVLVDGGRVRAVAPALPAPDGAEVIDAAGCWVTPGFVDNHTHYDAEVEAAPALAESVRHGVTTVTLGSCGLGMAVGEPGELADMFCRVEGVPRRFVAPLLERVKDWETPAGYLEHLDRLPLGPNVAALLGHSTIRARVLGLARSLDPRVRASRAELRGMATLLEGALDAGFLGLSVNTLRWDKMDGETHRSRPTPSTFAPWSEYRALTRVLRRRGRVFQGVPNVQTKVNLLGFLLESAGLGRRRLKTAVISLIDSKANRAQVFLAGLVSSLFNRVLRADFRFQSLPNLFDFWVDGLDVPVFEEIAAGSRVLEIADPDERARLLRDPAFRRRFRREWTNRLWGRAYHRDLDEARIVDCPDRSVVGMSFGDVGRARGQHPVDALLELVAEHGNALRWYTVFGNDRPGWLRWIARHRSVLVGFSDAGAHLRNIAHYNFPLRLLAMARDDRRLPVERAVHRLTGEIADWMNLDAGALREGARGDVAVIDPAGLDASLEAMHEVPMVGFEGLSRLVRRNDAAVRAVLVGGRVAVRHGAPVPELGRERGFGRVARAAGPA